MPGCLDPSSGEAVTRGRSSRLFEMFRDSPSNALVSNLRQRVAMMSLMFASLILSWAGRRRQLLRSLTSPGPGRWTAAAASQWSRCRSKSGSARPLKRLSPAKPQNGPIRLTSPRIRRARRLSPDIHTLPGTEQDSSPSSWATSAVRLSRTDRCGGLTRSCTPSLPPPHLPWRRPPAPDLLTGGMRRQASRALRSAACRSRHV